MSAQRFSVFSSEVCERRSVAIQNLCPLARRPSSIRRRVRRVAQAIPPKTRPQKRNIPTSTGVQILPPRKRMIRNMARRPRTKIPKTNNPIAIVVVQPCFPRFLQNRASFSTVSGNTTLRCRASTSCSQRSRLGWLATGVMSDNRYYVKSAKTSWVMELAITLCLRCLPW
jgi:hypothetical protein